MNHNLIPLSGYEESASARIGGKASHLAKLLSAGFPVPQGYVVPVAVYENFISLNGLKDKITKYLETTDFNDEENISRCSKAIKDLVQSGEMDRGFAEEIALKLHGAVVSREYGIPAVTAVKGARQIFKTGQKVTIDGNQGVIYIMEQ